MQSRIVFLLSLLPICTAVFSQQACRWNHPVAGAAIVLLPQQIGQSTDAAGKFRFENICPGKYTVKVQYLGYEDVTFDVQITGTLQRIIHLKEVITELHEVVVHHDASNTEHAQNFATLDERKLTETAGKTLGESLKEISGVNSIQTGPGIFKPVIHGVHSQRVLILNHGVRQEGQQWGAEHAPEIDPFIASNIVVIKDASAIKYGTDALGGVIVVNPPALPDKADLHGTINTVLQSNGRSGTFSGMLEGGINGRDGWGWRVQGTAKKAGDYHTPDYSLTNTGLEELNFSAAAGYHKEHTGFDVFFSHFQTTIGILKGTSISNTDDLENAMDREPPLYTSAFSYDIGAPRQEVSHNLLKLNAHVKTKVGEWRVQYGFQNNNRTEFDMRKGDLTAIPVLDLKLNTHSVEAEWETEHSSRRTLSVGVTGIYQANRKVDGTNRIPFIPNFTNISGGVFGIAKFYRAAWTIDIGGRYDYRYYSVKGFDNNNSYYSSAFNFNNVSITTGATAQLKNNQVLSVNLSSAWRPPHVAELFSIGTHQSAAAIEYGLMLNEFTNDVMNIDDVNFKTEQALKLVTTYQKDWKNLSVAVSPYGNYIFNYIFLRPEGVTRNIRGVFPYFRYRQTDALFVGADLSATWKAAKHIKVFPKVSLLRASDEKNNDFLVFIPSNKYEVAVRYEKGSISFLKNFYLESKTIYVAKQNRAPRVITISQINEAEEQGIDLFASDRSTFDFMPAPQGYWLWNLSAGVTVKSKKAQYDFRLASENTLNTDYREYTNRFRYYADELGRNIIFSLKCIF
jgi:iron complex outermembrane recepter protein